MRAEHESELLDYARSVLLTGGVVLVTGTIAAGRSEFLHEIASHATRAGAVVNAVTVDDTTTSDALAALCSLRAGVLAVDGLDRTDPIPALLNADDGTALLASCHALDAEGAIDRLISGALARGVGDRSASRLVRTHIDLVLVTGRNVQAADAPPEFMITTASVVDDGTLVPVYRSGPNGSRLTLPTAGQPGGRR